MLIGRSSGMENTGRYVDSRLPASCLALPRNRFGSKRLTTKHDTSGALDDCSRDMEPHWRKMIFEKPRCVRCHVCGRNKSECQTFESGFSKLGEKYYWSPLDFPWKPKGGGPNQKHHTRPLFRNEAGRESAKSTHRTNAKNHPIQTDPIRAAALQVAW